MTHDEKQIVKDPILNEVIAPKEFKVTRSSAAIFIGDNIDPFDIWMGNSHHSWSAIKPYCNNEKFVTNPIPVIEYYNELRRQNDKASVPEIHKSIVKLSLAFDESYIYNESILSTYDRAQSDIQISEYIQKYSFGTSGSYQRLRGNINLSRDVDQEGYVVFQYEDQGYLDVGPSGNLLRPAVSWPGEEFKEDTSLLFTPLISVDYVIFIGVDLNNDYYNGIIRKINPNAKIIIVNDRDNEFGDFTKSQLERCDIYKKVTADMVDNIAADIEAKHNRLKNIDFDINLNKRRDALSGLNGLITNYPMSNYEISV